MLWLLSKCSVWSLKVHLKLAQSLHEVCLKLACRSKLARFVCGKLVHDRHTDIALWQCDTLTSGRSQKHKCEISSSGSSGQHFWSLNVKVRVWAWDGINKVCWRVIWLPRPFHNNILLHKFGIRFYTVAEFQETWTMNKSTLWEISRWRERGWSTEATLSSLEAGRAWTPGGRG